MEQGPPAAQSVSKLTAVATLRARGFPYMLLDYVSAMVGFQLRTMAQAWLVLEMTDSDAWVGMANGLPAVPVAILALFGGVFVDRHERRVLLVTARLGFAASAVTAGALVASGVIEAPHVVALAFVSAASMSFGTTVSQTLVVDVVGGGRTAAGLESPRSEKTVRIMQGCAGRRNGLSCGDQWGLERGWKV